MPDDPETIDHCPACNAPMDVSAFAPFANVECPTCGKHSRVKLNFGPYKLTRRHAIGGMSMVFVAHDSTLDREVAVKILSEEFSKDETRIHAFEDEAKITASFSHPNVVRVLRTGKAFGRFYIAMELVTGGHFEHHIRERGKIPETELLPLAIEVAQGLKAAQTAGLIHRDVKPGNILLDSGGRAKLVDFGLALVTQEGKATASELWATPFYVPPETVEGKEEDFRSDIYALGSTLYHALAGTPPCNEESMSTTLLLKAKREIVPLNKMAPDISGPTCQIIGRAMAYEPNDRFSSYDEMIRLLRSSLKDLRHHPQGNPSRARRHQKKPPLIIAVAIIAAAATGLFLFLALFRSTSGETPPPPASVSDVKPPVSTAPTINPLGTNTDISQSYRMAREDVVTRKYRDAAEKFHKLSQNPAVQEPSRTWAGIEAIISDYLSGNPQKAQQRSKETLDHIHQLADQIPKVGSDLPTILSQLATLPPATYSQPRDAGARRVIAAMLAGLKNWEQGLLEEATECFKTAASTKLPAEEQWASIYQQAASGYLADYHILSGPLFENIPQSPQDCQSAIDELNLSLAQLKTRGRARFNIRAWQLDLTRLAKRLESNESINRNTESPEQ